MNLTNKQQNIIVSNTIKEISIHSSTINANAEEKRQFKQLLDIVNTGKIPTPYTDFQDFLWDWYQDFTFKTPLIEQKAYKSWLKNKEFIELAKQIKIKFKYDFIKNLQKNIKEIEQDL